MKAELTGKSERESLYGGVFHYLYFQGEDNKSYKTCIYEEMRNFKKWRDVLDYPRGTILSNLMIKEAGLINADSKPELVSFPEFDNEPKPKLDDRQLNLF
jgi:hypothetical protein